MGFVFGEKAGRGVMSEREKMGIDGGRETRGRFGEREERDTGPDKDKGPGRAVECRYYFVCNYVCN